MTDIFHRLGRVSMLSAAMLASANAAAAPNLYVGRWTVSDDKPTFSSRGIAYKTIDIAPCGKDYCGVSVGKGGACGPVLFRFLSRTVSKQEGLVGHGRWGAQTKNVEIFAYRERSVAGGRWMNLNLGDGHDFGERSGNMPQFSAGYSPAGAAHCVAR